ncbi:MAG: SIS domain-containing protein [Cytophagaceae bacterium]|nr:SIS domain-containing protein [Gemmatimonadaceae bacterium]
MAVASIPLSRVQARLHERNAIAQAFFAGEAENLARLSHDMADRFAAGGRLLALGRGPQATDAQHVVVEFVHPVIVGKPALPAIDVSAGMGAGLAALARPSDIVFGFGPPNGDAHVVAALEVARERGAMTVGLPGAGATYALQPATGDPFVHQEVVEMLYHVLWETVHVFLEHGTRGLDVGQAGFLYPFLGRAAPDPSALRARVADSILAKVADDAVLRTQVSDSQGDNIVAAARLILDAVGRGGTVITLGNGGSATDATDLAIDCVLPPAGYRAVPAVSLAAEPASLSAIANDVGVDVMFLRQLVAIGAAGDVVVAFSTSGGSRNVVSALVEARKRRMHTVAFLGSDGGDVVRLGLADVAIVVRSDYIPRIQEVQASAYHVLRATMEDFARGDD